MNKITIVTFNIPFFPDEIKQASTISGKASNIVAGDIGKAGKTAGLPAKKSRAKQLVEKIKSMGDEQPDVITLQEIWENKFKKKIRSELKSLYPHSHLDLTNPGEAMVKGIAGGKFKYLNSGLMILSKHRIIDTCRHVYKKAAGSEDSMAQKGLLGVTLELPDGMQVHVFTTHLQSQRSNKANATKIKQLKEARKKIREHTKHNSKAIILTGDFNLSDAKNPETIAEARAVFSGSADYGDFTDTYDQSKAITKSDRKLTASTWSSVEAYRANPKPSNTDGHHKIDQVWVLNNKGGGYSYVISYFGEELSDHLGERAVIELLDPNRAANDMIAAVLPRINRQIPKAIRGEGFDPWQKVTSGTKTLGKMKIAKKIKAKAKASYSIKSLKGLSSLSITSLDIDVFKTDKEVTQVTGTARLQVALRRNLTASVSGRIKASAAGISIKQNISGTVTARKVTGDGGGSFAVTVAFKQSSLDSLDVTSLTLGNGDIKVKLKGLGKFNGYLQPLTDSVIGLFKGQLKRQIAAAVRHELDDAFAELLPLI